jgi:hypothetical protein
MVILEKIGEKELGGADWRYVAIADHAIKGNFALDNDQFEIHIDNLYRLRLVGPPIGRFGFTDQPDAAYVRESKEQIRLTPLGRAFVAACRPPGEAVSRD